MASFTVLRLGRRACRRRGAPCATPPAALPVRTEKPRASRCAHTGRAKQKQFVSARVAGTGTREPRRQNRCRWPTHTCTAAHYPGPCAAHGRLAFEQAVSSGTAEHSTAPWLTCIAPGRLRWASASEVVAPVPQLEAAPWCVARRFRVAGHCRQLTVLGGRPRAPCPASDPGPARLAGRRVRCRRRLLSGHSPPERLHPGHRRTSPFSFAHHAAAREHRHVHPPAGRRRLVPHLRRRAGLPPRCAPGPGRPTLPGDTFSRFQSVPPARVSHTQRAPPPAGAALTCAPAA